MSGKAGVSSGGSQPPAGASSTGVDTGQGTPGQGKSRPADGNGRRRIRENLLALLLCICLSLLLFGPFILSRMNTWFLASQSQDGSIFIWMFRWWPYAIAHHLNPLFTTAAWAPGGINLAWVTSVPALGIVMAPLTQAFGPFFAFNVVELAAPALAAWTGYLLCRRIVGSFLPALIGGLCFGFSPMIADEVGQGHPNLALTFLIPLGAYLVLRLIEGSIRVRWFVPLLGLLLAVQLYLSTEIFATMTLMGVLFGVVGLALGSRSLRQRLLRATGPAAGAYAVALALGSPLLYAAFSRPHPYKPVAYTGIDRGITSFTNFLAYVDPGRFTILGGGQLGHRWGHDGNPWYFGIPLLLLLVVFLVTEWHRRRTRMLAAALAVTLVLSAGGSLAVFGAHIFPWRLVSAVPVLNRAQPGRLVGYAFLLLGIAVAMWLARPGSRGLRWGLAALALLAIAPNVTSNVWARQVPVPRLLTTGAYHRYLTPGEIVWVVDSRHSRPMVWQAQTDFSFRLAGGFFGVTPPGLHPPAAQAQLGLGSVSGTTPVASIRAFLASHDVGAVLMAEESASAVRTMAVATGVAGSRHGGVIVFQLAGGRRPLHSALGLPGNR